MSEKGFRYEFSRKEFMYFLFKKKICPNCGGLLKKNKNFETVDGSTFDTVSVPLYIKGREVKRYFYSFTCHKCNSSYELSELVK